MPTIDTVILLVGAGVLANLGLIAAVVLPRRSGQRDAIATGANLAPTSKIEPDGGSGDDTPPPGAAPDLGGSASSPAIDRIVRVVSLVFLAAAGLTVTISGAFDQVQNGVYILVAASILAVVFIGDLVPPRLSAAHHQIQVGAALIVVTVLVALTGGVYSPFVAGYFVLVGASALSSDDLAPMFLAIAASCSFLVIAALVPVPTSTVGAAGSNTSADAIGLTGIAWAGFTVIALGMLAYVATVVGRQQRAARLGALRLARIDPLTGLLTRSYVFQAIDQEIARAARIGLGFCLLMLDLDDLKPINDTLGHQAGDAVLRTIADIVRRTIRQTDLAGRYGGDEFLIVLPETDAAGALRVADKLKNDVAARAMRVDSRTFRTSVSVGLVSHPEDGATREQLMGAVDEAMYEAKRRGKNQIVGYVTRAERVPVAHPDMPAPGPITASPAYETSARSSTFEVSVSDVGGEGSALNRRLVYRPAPPGEDAEMARRVAMRSPSLPPSQNAPRSAMPPSTPPATPPEDRDPG